MFRKFYYNLLKTVFFIFPLWVTAQISLVDSIDELKNITPLEGEIVYVKGFNIPNDGGGGFFIYEALEHKSIPGIYIKPKASSVSGNWARTNYTVLNVNYFGAFGNDSINDTKAIQAAIDFSFTESKKEIYIPTGVYIIDSLTLRFGTKLKGDYYDSVLKASTLNRNSQSVPSLIKLDVNPIVNVLVENLTFDGNNQPLTCFYFEGIKKNDTHAGIWKSNFKNLEIRRFEGHGIFLKGGDFYKERTPNQMVIFENVRVKKNTNPSTNSLRIVGQNAQLSFINCMFDSMELTDKNTTTQWNVFIQKQVDTESVPAIIKFDTCTIQNASGGMYIEGAENISITNTWFENLANSIFVTSSASAILIDNCRFANASGYGEELEGYVLKAEENSLVTFENNKIAGKYTDLIIKTGGSKVKANNNDPKKAN